MKELKVEGQQSTDLDKEESMKNESKDAAGKTWTQRSMEKQAT